MKKGKVFSKGQIAIFVMALALVAAVWLNMRYSSNEKFLGEAAFVSSDTSKPAVKTSAKAEKSENYFEKAKKDRETALKEAQETIEETLKSANISEEEKKTALAKCQSLADRISNSVSIETLLKAKGFSDAVAVLGEDSANIVVSSEGLTAGQTLQIQDIVMSETDIPLGNIKIVTVS